MLPTSRPPQTQHNKAWHGFQSERNQAWHGHSAQCPLLFLHRKLLLPFPPLPQKQHFPLSKGFHLSFIFFSPSVQVLPLFLISTRNLTHLSIFHKLTSIHQNRTPAQVIRFNFVQTIVYPGITHRWKLGKSSQDEPPDPAVQLATHHNGSSDGWSPPLDWEESLPYCHHLFKVAEGWQPSKVRGL